jgi:lipopolysaccharide/colanic/teichoic acid biosynthesis glycosyltransferase
MYPNYLKRLFDFTLSFTGLLILLPVFTFIVLFLSIVNNGKPFFFQLRPGKNAKIFKVIKFKTMNDKKDIFGNLLPDSERITPIGNFIRKTSLDEIPQLLNVIKGDMSLVGPRPLVIDYLPLYNDVQRRRHEVRPGITGLAQINGRSFTLLSKKFEYDVWYVEHISFWLDLKIIFKTIINVFGRKDIGKGAENMMDIDDLHFIEKLQSGK